MPDTRDLALRAAAHDFGIRVYPAAAPTGELLVWLHGGAFMFGDLEMPEADLTARELAARGISVVSVDYTLAPLEAAAPLPPIEEVDGFPPPETVFAPSTRPRATFPVASLQTVAAVEWATEHAGELGADPDRIALGGASAGGNLAAGAALRLRDHGARRLLAQVLVYPVLHEVLPTPDDELAARMTALPGWMRFSPESTRVINANYLGGAASDPYAFPAGSDLRAAPPALIVASDLDDLRPSAEEYADELDAAGVAVEFVVESDATHGFLNMAGHPSQVVTIERIARFLTTLETEKP